MKKLLLQATVYVYEGNQEIQGFIGLNGEYIEGIFVAEAMQSQGIGKMLLDYLDHTDRDCWKSTEHSQQRGRCLPL